MVIVIACCKSLVGSAQSESLTMSKEDMYDDFDQFVEIVRNHNAQISIRKYVTSYDALSEIQKKRSQISSIQTSGEFIHFMNENVARLIDIHSYMLKLSKPDTNDFLWVDSVDIESIHKTLSVYNDYLRQCNSPIFSFGNSLLYHQGEYQIVNTVKFNGKQYRRTIKNAKLLKINGVDIDQYVKNHFHVLSGSRVRWDNNLQKYFAHDLIIPKDALLEFQNNDDSSTFIVELSKVRGVHFFANSRKQNKSSMEDVVYFEKEGILYIRIKEMKEGCQNTIIDSIFSKLHGIIPSKVILDVRSNHGGSDSVWIEILSTLSPDTIVFPLKMCFKSQQVLSKMADKTTVNNNPDTVLLYGDTLLCEKEYRYTLTPSGNNVGYRGLIFVFQDAFTYSAAHSLSSICRFSDKFVSIGVPTGTIAGRGCGPVMFQLKNSKFTFFMECDLDLTEIKSAYDCYQDMPEKELSPTLQDVVLFLYDNSFVYLSQEDPYFKTVLYY